MLWIALLALTGVVRDAAGHPAASVAVELKIASRTLTAKTDAEGRYRFEGIEPGTYAVHAPRFEGTVTVAESDAAFDIRLGEEFFDPPAFIVAGVTDTSQRGGHGSDPVLHSTEAMTKAVGEVADATTRRLLEQAVACYSRALYDEAARYFFEAADRDPSAIGPYLVLGRARNSPLGQMPGFSERMTRFARMHPENAWANYYVGTEASLKRAVGIDPRFEEAWFELGAIYSDRGKRSEAIAAWKKAPGRAEAHYRLSRAYREAGDAAAARKELAIYESLTSRSSGR